MNRRLFLALCASGALPGAAATPRRLHCPRVSLDNALRIAWRKPAGSDVFEGVECDGYPLVFRGSHGVLSASSGSEKLPVRHRLLRVRGTGGEDALEATVTLRNTGTRSETQTLTFATSTHPVRTYGAERVHFPLNAGPHQQLKPLGMTALLECDQPAPRNFAYYLEPAGSDPKTTTTPRLLLIPLACRHNPAVPWKVSLFGTPERPWKLASVDTSQGETGWTASTRITLQPGESITEKFYLLIHSGGPEVAWQAFHQLAHPDPLTPIAWLDDVKVHYYDYLSPGGAGGKRGLGYEEDAAHFRECQVGLATQHGYYPVWGDFIHPDRKTWLAMPSDAQGPVEMSLEKLRERCRLARSAGAKAALYLHAGGFDPTSRAARQLEDAVQIGPDGKRQIYAWDGPDIAVANASWSMSMAAPEWRKYLLQQAQWIMELINPDAIVVDETFAGLGYDHHPSRKGIISPHMIQWTRDLRKLLRGFGPDKALLTSDCSLSSFVMWADAEGGDHVYSSMLGAAAYRRAPVRYLSALGRRPWIPCAWNTQSLWAEQMDFARKTGAAVGVGNGWIEFAGLAGLPPALRRKMIADINTL